MIDTGSIRSAWLAVGLAFLAGFSADAQAPDDTSKDVRQDCLGLARLDTTRAVDDQTILFFMRGSRGEIFRNDLQAVCRDLGRNRGFSYDVTSSRNPRLCRNDVINVRDSGWTCPLGEFRLISKEEADELLSKRGEPGSAAGAAPTSEPVEADAGERR